MVQTLYFSEYDLSFFKTRGEMMRHLRKCKLQHPPGDEIYRCHYPGGRSVSMFEVRLTHSHKPPLCSGIIACDAPIPFLYPGASPLRLNCQVTWSSAGGDES